MLISFLLAEFKYSFSFLCEPDLVLFELSFPSLCEPDLVLFLGIFSLLLNEELFFKENELVCDSIVISELSNAFKLNVYPIFSECSLNSVLTDLSS